MPIIFRVRAINVKNLKVKSTCVLNILRLNNLTKLKNKEDKSYFTFRIKRILHTNTFVTLILSKWNLCHKLSL